MNAQIAKKDASGAARTTLAMTDKDRKALAKIRPNIKVIYENPEADTRLAYGPGVAYICEGVRRLGKLDAVAKEMGMAYSKAWKIVGEAEDALGIKLLERQKSLGCWLTEAGERLLDSYLEFERQVLAFGEFSFEQVGPTVDGAKKAAELEDTRQSRNIKVKANKA